MLLDRRYGFPSWVADHGAVVPRGGCCDQLPMLSSDRAPLDLLSGGEDRRG